MSALRPLPAHFSLEFERKEAKALLRLLRAGDPEALVRARAQHSGIESWQPDRIQLADAQLVLAREYGFASWPKLVRYFDDAERQRLGDRPHSPYARDFYESGVRALLVQHRQRRQRGARTLARYVPRLYAMPADAVFAAEIAEDEARLAVAREHGWSTWETLLDDVTRGTTGAGQRRPAWTRDAFERAALTIGSGDLDALRLLVESHPELLRPAFEEGVPRPNLLRSALFQEMCGAPVRAVVDWLVTQGFDLQQELNAQLFGPFHGTPDDVAWLLDRGADPNCVGRDGAPVLEHALLRYMNGAAVDVLAARARPRRALWIAAGLGDVAGVRQLLDRRGRPTAEARRITPPYELIAFPTHPDPVDEEILLEAFCVGMVNGRIEVLEYMASRGFDVNTMCWDTPVLNVAVGNLWVPVVATLLRCGANPDIVGSHPNQTAREIAAWHVVSNERDSRAREVATLLGVDADAVLAARDAHAGTPPIHERLQEALGLAADDAYRLGQSEVRPENLLIGLLRAAGLAYHHFRKARKLDLERLHADFAERLDPPPSHEAPGLPMSTDAELAMERAVAAAKTRRRDYVRELHLLYGLTVDEHDVAATIVARYGASASALNAAAARDM
jgi:hypothetical protein